MKNLFLFFLSFAIFTQVFAQKKDQNPEERAERQAKHFKKQFDLTDEQVAKVKEANLVRMNKVNALRGQKGKKTDMKAAITEFDTSLKGILTAEQLKKYEARKDEAPARHAENRTKRLEKELGLTEEQVPQVHDALEKRAEKLMELQNSTEDKKGKKKQIIDEFEADMKTALQPNQFGKYQSMRAKNKGKAKEAKNKGKGKGQGKGQGKGKGNQPTQDDDDEEVDGLE